MCWACSAGRRRRERTPLDGTDPAARWLPAAVLVGALGCGLIAGVFFAFSAFVMRGLSRLPAEQGAAAMRAVNAAVFGSAFLVLFLATAALCLLLGVVAVPRWGRPDAPWLLAGALLYVLGVFAVTAAANVPLNDALAAADPASLPAVWARYLRVWIAWNHLRTVASLAATAALIFALLKGK